MDSGCDAQTRSGVKLTVKFKQFCASTSARAAQMSATHEEIANGQRAISAHAGYARKRYSELEKEFKLPTRRIITDAATVEKGERMETQRVQVLESLKPKQNTARDRAAAARELEDFERTHEHLLV